MTKLQLMGNNFFKMSGVNRTFTDLMGSSGENMKEIFTTGAKHTLRLKEKI